MREDARRQAAIDAKRIEEEYRQQAEDRAKTITDGGSYASEYVAEKMVSVAAAIGRHEGADHRS